MIKDKRLMINKRGDVGGRDPDSADFIEACFARRSTGGRETGGRTPK